jgi:hypothetical protein
MHSIFYAYEMIKKTTKMKDIFVNNQSLKDLTNLKDELKLDIKTLVAFQLSKLTTTEQLEINDFLLSSLNNILIEINKEIEVLNDENY